VVSFCQSARRHIWENGDSSSDYGLLSCDTAYSCINVSKNIPLPSSGIGCHSGNNTLDSYTRVLSLNLGLGTGNSGGGSRFYSVPLEIPGIILRLDHNRLLPNSSYFIIHRSSYNSTLYIVVIDNVVKLITHIFRVEVEPWRWCDRVAPNGICWPDYTMSQPRLPHSETSEMHWSCSHWTVHDLSSWKYPGALPICRVTERFYSQNGCPVSLTFSPISLMVCDTFSKQCEIPTDCGLIPTFAKSVTRLYLTGVTPTENSTGSCTITFLSCIPFQSYTLSNDTSRPKFNAISIK
jgi:hypothetical protein